MGWRLFQHMAQASIIGASRSRCFTCTSRCSHNRNSQEEHVAMGKVYHHKGISHSWNARHHIPNSQFLPCGIDGGGTVPSPVIQQVVTIPARTVTAHLDQPRPDLI